MSTVPRPLQVQLAVYLIVSTFIVGAVKTYIDLEFLGSLGPIQFLVSVMVFTVLVVGFITYKLWSGKNWARVVFTVLYFGGMYSVFKGYPAEAERNFLVLAGSIWQMLAQLAAIILTFLPSSNQWFKVVKAAKNS